MRAEPFALLLYREVMAGMSIEDLAETTGIPLPRVQQRVRAAWNHLNRTAPAPEECRPSETTVRPAALPN